MDRKDGLCHVCGKTFTTRSGLNKHKKVCKVLTNYQQEEERLINKVNEGELVEEVVVDSNVTMEAFIPYKNNSYDTVSVRRSGRC